MQSAESIEVDYNLPKREKIDLPSLTALYQPYLPIFNPKEI